MGDKTAIEWTDASWNPLRGCTAVSAGCDHCYAASVAFRFSGEGQPYEGLAVKDEDGNPQWTGKIMLVPEKLDEPIRWQKPRRIFVNSMSDLFHAKVPREYVDQVFAVMAATPRHTYQVLTKRPLAMARYLLDRQTPERIERAAWALANERGWCSIGADDWSWPLPNVWIGTSVEDQAAADARIPHLLTAPAAVRFLSMEPLLGPVDLAPWLSCEMVQGREVPWPAGTIHGVANPPKRHSARVRPRLGWVIAGGESSGPEERRLVTHYGDRAAAHMYVPTRSALAWVRDIRDQCQAAAVPFLFKQWGGPTPKSGGRELDGRTWDQYPEVAK